MDSEGVGQFQRNIPTAAKADFLFCDSYGTAEAVPFQGTVKLTYYGLAVVIPSGSPRRV
jgi:hypothetical protein